MLQPLTWCPQCGPNVRIDETGSCRECGVTAAGNGADAALIALRDTAATNKTNDRAWSQALAAHCDTTTIQHVLETLAKLREGVST